jgi:hypothetical protein
MNPAARRLALRLLVYGLVVSWLAKWDFFVAAAVVYRERPLLDAFFPRVLQSLWLLGVALCLPIALAFVGLVRNTPRALATSIAAFALGSLVLMLHQGSYNDATFVTSFWAALWGLWLASASRPQRPAQELPARAAFLVQLVIALMFFGGAVGKLTPGYFDGSVMYGVYFAERTHFTFALLRALLSPAQLHVAAQVYSLAVIAIEATLACMPILPARASLKLALAAFGALVVLNNLRLLSVVGPLAALCVAALVLTRSAQAGSVSAPALVEPRTGE